LNPNATFVGATVAGVTVFGTGAGTFDIVGLDETSISFFHISFVKSSQLKLFSMDQSQNLATVGKLQGNCLTG
jgi:hypothetical protein